MLTRPPEQYTVGEILRLTEGSLAPVACLDGDCKGCSRSDECPTLDVWKNLDKLINDYLDGVTLDALVAPNLRATTTSSNPRTCHLGTG